MSSPTHASTPLGHYDLLQPPSPKDVLMDTPLSDHLPFQGVKPVDYMSYRETLNWLHNTASAPTAKGEGPYSDSYYAAYPHTPPPDLKQPVKAPNSLKVQLAWVVLRRVLIERKSLGDTKDSLERDDLEWHKGDEAIKTFGLETKSSLGLDCHEQEVLYT